MVQDRTQWPLRTWQSGPTHAQILTHEAINSHVPQLKTNFLKSLSQLVNRKFPGNVTNTGTGVIILNTRIQRPCGVAAGLRLHNKQQCGSQLQVHCCVARSSDCQFNGPDMNNRSTDMNIHLTKTQNMGNVNVPVNNVAVFPCTHALSPTVVNIPISYMAMNIFTSPEMITSAICSAL